jgi:hypothetical protein
MDILYSMHRTLHAAESDSVKMTCFYYGNKMVSGKSLRLP